MQAALAVAGCVVEDGAAVLVAQVQCRLELLVGPAREVGNVASSRGRSSHCCGYARAETADRCSRGAMGVSIFCHGVVIRGVVGPLVKPAA